MFNFLQKKQTNDMLASCAIALFSVLFLWNFWERGVRALGINFFIFLFLIFLLFNWHNIKKEKFFNRNNIICQLPIFLIFCSFLIYENPFIKAISLVILPILFVVFYNYAQLEDNKNKYWGFNFLNEMFTRVFSFLACIDKAVKSYIKVLLPKSENKKNITKIVIGVLLFAVLAVVVIIPLLSSADKEFASKINFFYVWIKNLIEFSTVMKITVFCVLSVSFMAGLLAWQSQFDFKEKGSERKNLDNIISGIVLGGVLALYLLFLWVQIERLLVGALPIDFKETENLVKSGFWQLIFLSVINIGFFTIYYKKTSVGLQKVLNIFTFASLFLIISAAWRMALYVIYYGFSYEKFFASYAVIFCIILFCWIIFKLFRNIKIDVVKFVLFLFLWMYGIIAIFPSEQFILRANIELAKCPNSRIDLYEMTMLSSDVYNLAKENNFEWGDWFDRQTSIIEKKEWYEMGVVDFFIQK
ncbi:MAG: DUF4153 domain-containing protein [bacterium]